MVATQIAGRNQMAEQNTVVRDEDARLQPVRLFSTFINRLGDGTADPQIMAEMQRAIEDIHAHAKRTAKDAKGWIKLRVDIKCDDQGLLGFGFDVDSKVPKPPRRGSIAWHTANGKLTFKDPKQTELPFVREVKREEPTTVEVPESEAERPMEV